MVTLLQKEKLLQVTSYFAKTSTPKFNISLTLSVTVVGLSNEQFVEQIHHAEILVQPW